MSMLSLWPGRFHQRRKHQPGYTTRADPADGSEVEPAGEPGLRPDSPVEGGNGLRRELSEWDAAAIIIGIIIGVGIFVTPSYVARLLPDSSWILLAWLLGGVLSLLGAFCYAELSSTFPRTGGDYVYLSMAYGRWAGFLFGWAKLVVIRTGSIAATAIAFSEYMTRFLPVAHENAGASNIVFGTTEEAAVGLAVLAVIVLTCINIAALRFGRDVQNFLTVVKLLALGVLILLPIIAGAGSVRNFQQAGPMPQGFDLFFAFGTAMVIVLWAFGGWSESALVAGEVREPGKALPRSIILGTLVVTLLYVIANIVFLYVFPAPEMMGKERIGAAVAARAIGPVGADFVTILIVISTLGALNGLILTGARITYAAGQDHVVFYWLGRRNDRFGTPALALLVQALFACGLILILRTFKDLVVWTGFAVWLFYGMVGVSIYILRRKYPDVPRPYRTWGYPVTPFVFVVVCTGMMISAFSDDPWGALLCAALILLGLPVYLALSDSKPEEKGTNTAE